MEAERFPGDLGDVVRTAHQRIRSAPSVGSAVLRESGEGWRCWQMYKPNPLNNAPPALAAELAEIARNRPLAIYAGAGLSQASPTNIPDGATLALLCHERLVETLGPKMQTCPDPKNLTAVADTAAAAGGRELIRQVAVDVADFRTAIPNFGHELLGLLVLEGIAVAITTNWDDCIERAVEPERILAIVSDQDRQQIQEAALLKVHGCATRPATILITTDDLTDPPTWARHEVNVRLSDSHAVFVGIGDVANYVRVRIEEAKRAVGAGGKIFVVSPSIDRDWSGSQWEEILPDLPDDRRVALTSDKFLDHFAAAYMRRTLRAIFENLRDELDAANAFNRARQAFHASTSIDTLRWLRYCCFPRKAGDSIMSHQSFSHALIALGRLGDGVDLALLPSGRARVGDTEYEVLAARGAVTVPRFRREALARLTRYRSDGRESNDLPTFLVAGAIGRFAEAEELPRDVLDESNAEDVVGGALAVRPVLIRAEEV